ncbi:MAG: DUF1844 domain-containing protein [Planctomycetota bacterium]
MTDETPKLIVDDDWKSEAKREKERLSEQSKPSPAEGAGGPAQDEPMRFKDLVRTFASQAALYLGLIPEPQSKQRLFAPDLARLNIDFLSILEEKTKGNLTDEESTELTQTVAELRALFVETTAAVQQAVAEGKIPAQDPSIQGMGQGMGPTPTPDLRTPAE